MQIMNAVHAEISSHDPYFRSRKITTRTLAAMAFTGLAVASNQAVDAWISRDAPRSQTPEVSLCIVDASQAAPELLDTFPMCSDNSVQSRPEQIPQIDQTPRQYVIASAH